MHINGKNKQTPDCLVMYFPSSHLNLNKCFRVAYKSVSLMCSNNWESVEQDPKFLQNLALTADDINGIGLYIF